LVISTPGSEPDVPGGYAAVILADAGSMLGFPSLRALEQSALKWANAAAKLSPDGILVFVGLKDELADQARHLDFFGMVKGDYEDRKELSLPPVTRLASVTSVSGKDLGDFVTAFRTQVKVSIREVTASQPGVFAFCYEYSNGAEIASLLRELTQDVSAKSKTKKPGQRLFRIAMDYWQVI
jgi:primosomal protein N' (replication factor Y)